jgi:RNA polymerase sigma-70 factor (ECF subfamily)
MDSFDELEFSIASDTQLEDEVLNNEDRRLLVEAMLKLPENYKDVVLMYYSNEYDLKDIAEILGITPENAKKRWQRGKEKLTVMLREGGVADGARK